MGRKKKFIEKGEGVKFYLVHRSQKDPLYLDENLGEHVLVPAEDTTEHSNLIQSINNLTLSRSSKSDKEKEELRRKRLEEQHKYGIYYEDDYDYLQHLKERDNDDDKAELDEAVKIGNVLIKNDINNNDTAETGETSRLTKLNLPSSVFASKYEEDVGYFNQAAPDHDPKINWDPDIVHCLDEETDVQFEDIEDDFFLKANSETPLEREHKSDEEEDEDDNYSDGQFDNESESQSLKEFETRSRFTNYSMTSSVIRRNEKLKYLDEHFEKIFEQYDEDQIGALDMEEIDGYRGSHDAVLENALAEFELNSEKKLYMPEQNRNKSRKSRLAVLREESGSDEDDDEEEEEEEETETQTDSDETEKETDNEENVEKKDYELVRFTRKKTKEDRLDCESIISTYSSLYNRPAVIKESNSGIKLSKKTGLPLGVFEEKPKSKKELDRLDHKLTRILPEIQPRKPNETKEEKKARKAEVKEHRRQRRVEKKINKLAFKEEKAHQIAQLANNQQASNSIKLPL